MHFIQKRAAVVVTFCFPLLLQAQLTLDSAYQWARNNYPLIKQRDLIQQTSALTIENISKGLLPQIVVSGQGSYQSDVTKVNIPVPGIKVEPLSKDQYKIAADINQLLFDGGAIRDQKAVQELTATTEQQRLEVELYKIRDRVNQLFLGILLTDEQIKQTQLLRNDLATGIKKVAAQVQNGAAFRSALNTLRADSLRTEQRAIELLASRESLITMLGVFIGRPVSNDLVLAKPFTGTITNSIRRPEMQLFNAQERLAAQQDKLIAAKNLPRASLFFQGGYARPALNFLKNEFDWYYVTGLRVNWSLGNLYTYRNDKKLVSINLKTIDAQRSTFLQGLELQLVQQQAEINKYEKLMATDQQIIDLRKSVKDAALAQLENGVITSSDYIREVDAEDQARLTLITHELQLLQAKINYQTITGK